MFDPGGVGVGGPDGVGICDQRLKAEREKGINVTVEMRGQE
jgi:hypothetical protein